MDTGGRYIMPFKKYDILDILNVVTTEKLKTQTIKDKLIKLDMKYENIHIDWTKKLLLKLHRNGLVHGGLDHNFYGYVWYIPEGLRYDPQDFIKILTTTPKKYKGVPVLNYYSTSDILQKLNKQKRMYKKYSNLSVSMAVTLLKSIESTGAITGTYSKDSKTWMWAQVRDGR